MLIRPLAVRAACSLFGGSGNSLSAARPASRRVGLTLVEMLVALAITLLLMAAVVTVFANVTGSVTRRRATIEMSGQLRSVREQLSRDLEGATCPAIPWRRPEANEGYIEIIEGPQTDTYPSVWLYHSPARTVTETINGVSVEVADTHPDTGLYTEGVGTVPGVDLTISSLPGSNLRDPSTPDDEEGRGRMIGSYAVLPEDVPTDGRGLGDADDILMLTVRNEREPFVGRIPPRPGVSSTTGNPGPNLPAFGYADWGIEEYESPLAEVVWFAVENPPERDDAQTFAFGEPGYRTIYRRALLIAPELDYDIRVGNVVTEPGIVRVLPANVQRDEIGEALACLVSFQERYDLSVRLEWDARLVRWTLRANTLGDLTKRENRYEHHGGYFVGGTEVARAYPYAVTSRGSYSGASAVRFVHDPELPQTASVSTPEFRSVVTASDPSVGDQVVGYEPAASTTSDIILDSTNARSVRPYAYVRQVAGEARPASARAILNEDGATVAITLGLAPLSGSRRGDDIMMTDVLAFDVRIYDPGAPVYAYYIGGVESNLANEQPAEDVILPGEPAWASSYTADATNNLARLNGLGTIGTLNTAVVQTRPVPGAPGNSDGNVPFSFARLGAYADLNYGRSYSDFAGDQNPEGFSDFFDPFGFNPQFISHEVLSRDRAPYHPSLGVTDSWFMAPGQIRAWRPVSSGPNPFALRVLTPGYSLFDTWSWHYESNGLNEDQDLQSGLAYAPGDLPTDLATLSTNPQAIDEGLDGFDSASIYAPGRISTQGGVDDPAERETRPPYDRPLRGVQVQVRVYERDSRQVREATIRESFVPE